MEKEFVTYEIALKLKDLGFNEECFRYYQNGKLVSEDELIYHIRNGSSLSYNYNTKSNETDCVDWNNEHIIPISAPLWQQAEYWLKDKFNLSFWIEQDIDDNRYYIQFAQLTETKLNEHFNRYSDSYYAARIKLILKIIEFLTVYKNKYIKNE